MIRSNAMTSRRHFLQIGITATAWPLVARATHAAGAGARPATPLLGVVYDTRFAESVAFARRSAGLGFRTYAIDGDMTRLWYDEVYHHWRRRPTALAGLTAHGPLFCFAELARDVRMRVVFRAEHRATADGAAMADVVANCLSGRIEIASATFVSGIAPSGTEPLYTWVIAPRPRRV
jgi:hypothetical protein